MTVKQKSVISGFCPCVTIQMRKTGSVRANQSESEDHLSCCLVEMLGILAKMFHFHSGSGWQWCFSVECTWPGPVVAMRLDEVRHGGVVFIFNYLQDLRGTTGVCDVKNLF